ncbi:CHRD domain-containing protein [Horticoccus sp. 23ND18S-11]|uniref:CHRD domain-containing protein n=1 Tax=Horticoccus sp. 23ND18S-11 TaxID=3391832 RepID=UPI0039C97865
MKIIPVRGLLFAGALCALVINASGQVVELRATINAAQENPATSSPATGSAIMLYDVGTNLFDLIVTINGMANTATASHIHEAAAGVNGPVVTNLGADAVYTRTGTTLTASFRGIRHGGDRLKLIQGGAYFNIHSAQFPGGEVRGQLIPRPKRLYANMDVAQEQAAFPALNLSGLNDTGAAIMLYDPATHTIRLRLSLYNFNNPFTNSHFHAQIPGLSGPVVVNLGTNSNAGGYSSANGHISGTFDIPMTGADPIAVLTGGLYLNFHSQVFTGGELRGQVWPSDEVPGSRLGNLSVRGFVGTGDQVLIQGITVNGPEPIRVFISAKGPSLSGFGIAGALANPRLDLYDSGRRRIASNDDIGTLTAGSELASLPGVPTNSAESALVVVLPPGNYSAIVSAATGTGIALLEVSDLRNAGSAAVAPASAGGQLVAQGDGTAAKAPVELCTLPIAVTVANR